MINDAFDLLLGSDGTPGRPLSAVVLLLRGLWEYLHHHGLGRLLAKPFKLLLALRSVLLVRRVRRAHDAAAAAAVRPVFLRLPSFAAVKSSAGTLLVQAF